VCGVVEGDAHVRHGPVEVDRVVAPPSGFLLSTQLAARS
jgi:hypothetical protein